MKVKLILFFLLVGIIPATAQNQFVFKGEKKLILDYATFYIDSSELKQANEVLPIMNTERAFKGKLDLDYSPYSIWIKVSVFNEDKSPALMAIFENPLIDSIEGYAIINDTILPISHNYLGDGYPARKHKGTFQKFKLIVPHGEERAFLFKISSTEQLLLPITVCEEQDAISINNLRDTIYGAFMGVVLVMLFYNLFVFAATRDTNYLYYVLYILFIGLGQIALSGHLYSLLIGEHPLLFKYFIVVLPALSGIFAILFIKHFLQAKLFSPGLDKALSGIAIYYGLAALVRFMGYDHISARMMDVIGLPGAILVFILAFKAYKKGFKSAIYFIAAWSIFITGVVLFVFRNLSILPFNWITTYTLPMGAALEVALLSFALADKINTLQAQKREKEQEALFAALENERLIKEQNALLEQKVHERTIDLARTNEQLSETLHDLKSTQSQLVEQEKMASLGQLTAGIAHEINNPINFVTSNINPLKRDIGMIQELMNHMESLVSSDGNADEKRKMIANWKEEIDYEYLQEEMSFLLKGIDEGAHRTAEIVKGLRVFARNDEDTILNTDVIEGIESTLVILNNQFGKIKINRNYQGPILIDCYPGKLNQVFLNLLSNSIYAIHARYGEEVGGEITISLEIDNDLVYLRFEDNGIGMSDEVQKKIFEPFFTTKPVGQGTGLGMSIVFKTIDTHKGKISLTSEAGKGTIFEIQLNRSLIF